MQSKPSKPYSIQLYAQGSNVLKNKFKFSLAVTTVQQLKVAIQQKLIGKNQIQAQNQLIVKDFDDFQLASDDEVDKVIADAKVRVYVKGQSLPSPPMATSPSAHNTATVSPAINVPPNHNLVSKNTVLNLSKLHIPVLEPQIKSRIKLHCPQIRKAAIELPFDLNIDSYLDLSKHMVSQLGLESDLKAIIYNKRGQPFLYNLDLMHTRLPKLDLAEPFYALFTRSPSTVDEEVIQPKYVESSLCEISVVTAKDKFTLQMDLQNTVGVLKYKVFKLTRIHPSNQIIKFANKPLSNSVESLKSYGVVANSILELVFKLNSNLVPCTFADKFYYKDIKHTRQQSQTSIVELRSNLLAIAAHFSEEDKLKFPTFIRAYTQNLPLTYAIKCLMKNNFISQTHRIALEEGFLLALSQYIQNCLPQLPNAQYPEIFTYFRDFMDFVLQGFKKITNLEELKANQQDVQIQVNCHFTVKPIKMPRFVKLDNGEVVLVDKQQFQEQILKGFTFPLLKTPKKEQLFATKDLEEFYFLYQLNQLDNPSTNSLYWIGFTESHPQLVPPELGAIDKYKGLLQSYPDLKVHQPLQIKNKASTYLIIKNKDGKTRVFVSKNKDIAKPYNIFNVFTGEEEAVNLDLMSANVKSENVEEVIDVKDMKPVITRDPKEAIAILFDVSGSMGTGFFNEPDLKRIGAVKSFFQAFAYRTIAYNLEHVVSLFFFDHIVENQCGFTEAIYDFNRLISKANPRGSTLMYDAIVTAVTSLKKFQAQYPNCLLRIIALTDGEDTGSKHSVEQTTRILSEEKIIIDSFAVGANCEGLKIISKASGGKCYLTRNLEESLKLFEQQTVLSVRARKQDRELTNLSVSQRIEVAKLQPFDLPNNVHEFNMPKSQGGGLSAKDILKKMQKTQESQKISSNGSLKRIAKEIQVYTDNPHPFVAIFPCANINLWKILLLGPKETPYENGLFLLYAQFPGDYPFKAPEIRFITPIYHCNMNSQGRICHSVFDRNYSPALTFRQIVDCVYGLILTPEPEDPLDNVIASFYLSDYQKYYSNAIQFTKDKASHSVQKLVDELFGKIVDDGERKQKEKEIDQWVKLAKSCN